MGTKPQVKQIGKTLILIAPNFAEGHFDSWRQEIDRMLSSSDFRLISIDSNWQIDRRFNLSNSHTKSITNITHQFNDDERSDPIKRIENRLKKSYLGKNVKKYFPGLSRYFGKSFEKISYLLAKMKKQEFHNYKNPSSRNFQIQEILDLAEVCSGDVILLFLFAKQLLDYFEADKLAISRINNQEKLRVCVCIYDTNNDELNNLISLNILESYLFSNLETESYFNKVFNSHGQFRTFYINNFSYSKNYLNNQAIRKVNNRIILAGSVSERKNLSWFIDLATSDKEGIFNWRIAGKIHMEGLSTNTLKKIEDISKGIHKHITIKNEYLSDVEFEKEIFESKFVFLCYKKWNADSNLLTKALAYRKNIITTPDCNFQVQLGNLGIANVIQENIKFDEFKSCILEFEYKPNLDLIQKSLDSQTVEKFASTFRQLLNHE